jgi:dolichyl-phosphate beta-glucosyltransferase
VLEYPKNRGKGGAVRAGMEVAQGKFILMVDADGATTFS